MRCRHLLMTIFIGGICLFGSGSRAFTSSPPSSISLELEAGGKSIEAWVVISKQELEQGLSGAPFLRENEGMIFILPRNTKTKFHMKGVTIPLTIAYLDRRGRILRIEDMDPETPDRIYEAPDEARYALEMNRGWFRRNAVRVGDRVRRKS